MCVLLGIPLGVRKPVRDMGEKGIFHRRGGFNTVFKMEESKKTGQVKCDGG